MDEMDICLHSLAEEKIQHLAPNCSPDHLKLRAAARKAEQNEETLRNLLWLINAHDGLLGFHRIADNLLSILDKFDGTLSNGAEADQGLPMFRGWREVLRWIIRTYKDPESLQTHSVSLHSKNPVFGYGVTRYPLYGCLWERVEESKCARAYLSLQWQMLLAHAGYLFRESRNDQNLTRTAYEEYGSQGAWGVFPDSPEEAMRSVRKLAEESWRPLLEVLPVRRDAAKYLEKLSCVTCPIESGEEQQHNGPGLLREVQSFLEKVHSQRDWVEREGGHTGASVLHPHSHSWSIDATPGDASDPDDRWPSARLLTVSKSVSHLTPDELAELDLDAEEIAEQEQWCLVEPDDPVKDAQQLAIRSALAARGESRHVQMAHQLLPWQYNQLTIQELAHLLRKSGEAFNSLGKSRWNDDQYHTAELVVLIRVILWTGSSLERACNLEVLTGQAEGEGGGKPTSETDLLFDLDNRQWRMRPISPKYRSQIPDPQKQAHLIADCFVLPDVAETAFLLRKLLEQRRQPQTEQSAEPQNKSAQDSESDQPREINGRMNAGCLFLRGVEDYRNDLTNWLRDPENNLTGRVTLRRIGTFLFHRLIAATGDLMAAVLITGHDHPQARAQKFYAVYSEANLQKIYSEVTDSALRLARRAADLPPHFSSNVIKETKSALIGARLCAKRTEVEKAIRRLQDQIQRSGNFKDFTEFVRFHNFYTVYTVFMFAYATAMRAIRTPYLSLDKIDQETGFAFISDKDDDDQHKTRLVWVPPFVVEQMQSYADHLSALASDSLQVRAWHEPCCFLTENGKPLEVRPKTLTENMPFLALPANHHRKFLRLELLSSRAANSACPPEVVNGWLGHAFQGEELWGPHSSFSYSEYKEILKTHLQSVLEGLGWRPLKSPLV